MGAKEKNIILFVNRVPEHSINSISKYGKINGKKFRIAVIQDVKKGTQPKEEFGGVDIELMCDFNDSEKLLKTLKPYKDEILVVTCRIEGALATSFAKLIPHVPYVKSPTAQSLQWATDKVGMREMLSAYDKDLVPPFLVVKDSKKETLDKIKNKLSFPLVLKPASLAQSLLVSMCFHKEELETDLKKMLKNVERIYKENSRKTPPRLLVEEFMEGDIYSIDGYVNSKGKIYFCPMVHIKTGKDIGFDDFFGYQQLTPTRLSKSSIESAQEAGTKAIYALGLRSTTFHTEFMKTEDGWKIIEVGARVGGFRHRLYELTYGINHGLNDVLIRMPKTPIIPKKRKGFAVALKMFAKKEGYITELKGIKKIQELKSFVEMKINKKVGDKCLFAKHGGKSVCNITMFNKDRSKLLADIRRVEQTLIIKTER